MPKTTAATTASMTRTLLRVPLFDCLRLVRRWVALRRADDLELAIITSGKITYRTLYTIAVKISSHNLSICFLKVSAPSKRSFSSILAYPRSRCFNPKTVLFPSACKPARINAAATALTGTPVPSSWLPMAVTMVAISAGSQPISFKILQAITAPDWEWSFRFTRLPISCRYPAIFASSIVRSSKSSASNIYPAVSAT